MIVPVCSIYAIIISIKDLGREKRAIGKLL